MVARVNKGPSVQFLQWNATSRNEKVFYILKLHDTVIALEYGQMLYVATSFLLILWSFSLCQTLPFLFLIYKIHLDIACWKWKLFDFSDFQVGHCNVIVIIWTLRIFLKEWKHVWCIMIYLTCDVFYQTIFVQKIVTCLASISNIFMEYSITYLYCTFNVMPSSKEDKKKKYVHKILCFLFSMKCQYLLYM